MKQLDKKCPKCRYEPEDESHIDKWCKKCDTSHMMMDIVLDEYISTNGRPDVTTELMMAELDFLYKRNITLFGYLNTAVEVCFDFLFYDMTRIPRTDLKELNQSKLPDDEIITVLEQGLLIRQDKVNIYPGVLTDKMANLRLARIQIRDPEWQRAMTEVIGLIAIALTKALFEIYGAQKGRGARFPRSAMATLHLLAHLMLEADRTGNPVDSRLALTEFFNITSGMLTRRQQRYATYIFLSVVDGRPRLLEDYDDSKDELVFADVVVNFLERTREQIREHKRRR